MGKLEVYTSSGALKMSARAHPDIQEFTADGTWVKPDGATWVEIYLVGAGGGGGNGYRNSAGTDVNGGGGGGGGSVIRVGIPANALASSELVTIGVGGVGGPSATAIGDQQDGADGTATIFAAGTAYEFIADAGEGGGAGTPNVTTTNTGGQGGGESDTQSAPFALRGAPGADGGINGLIGAVPSNDVRGGGDNSGFGAAGGGCGGGRNAAETNSGARDGGDCYDALGGSGPAGGGGSGTAGADGRVMGAWRAPGAGGGGGAGTNNTDAFGADGGYPGGGGGGGGGKRNNAADTSGGDGADGYAMVISW